MSVFVTDAGYKHTLGIVRSLGCRDLVVDVGSSSNDLQLSSFSKYCRMSFVYPDPKKEPDKFIHFIKKICEKFDYDVVIPVGYTATFCLSAKRGALDENIRIPISDFSSYKIAANKGETILLAEKIGVPTPKTIFLHHGSELDDLKNITYPLVVKGIYEGGIVRFAYNKQDLKMKFEEIYNIQGSPPLIQEFIKGEGYGFFALFRYGEPRAIFMHKRIRELAVMGGPSTCAVSVYDSKLLDYGLKLLKYLKWHGVAMVEFKKDSTDGTFKLMEINPKFWGSLDLALASGVDFPFLLYKMIMDGDVDSIFSYKKNIKFVWPFPDDLIHTLKKPKDLPYFLSDLINPRVKKNISINDIGPFSFPVIKGISIVTSKFIGKITTLCTP